MLKKQEPKGTKDWFPEEFKIRQFIFSTWRRLCERYGFAEYLTPLVENADIYRAKSGEDVGGKELVTFTDLGKRELSIRPEMTPSVVRMVSKIYASEAKPIKYFSIANFMRNEKPQRGRNREFWQLNCDIFGSNSINADIEIMQLALDIILEINPPKDSFVLSINSRNLINDVLELTGASKLAPAKKTLLIRTLDKWKKIPEKVVVEKLREAGLKEEGIKIWQKFINSASLEDLAKILPKIKTGVGFKEVQTVKQSLSALGYQDFINFDPTVIRGFDYYNGLVFEVFDKHPDNNRAMFGGGRYNGLAEIFGEKNFPAVGFAPGDEAWRLFLESWNLLPNLKEQQNFYYLPILDKNLNLDTTLLAKKLRQQGLNILLGFEEQKIGKALDFANKKKIAQVIIFGTEEKEKKVFKIKDMLSGKEKEKKL